MARFVFASGERIDADDAVSLSPQHTASAAMHPVEVGSDYSDHIQPAATRVMVELIFTPDAAGREDVTPPAGPGRPAACVARLAQACAKGEVLDWVEWDGQVWTTVALTNVSPPRAFRDGDGRKVTVEFQQLQIAEAKVIEVKRRPPKRKPARSVKPSAGMADRGTQPTVGPQSTYKAIDQWRAQQSLMDQPEFIGQTVVP